MGFAGGRLLVLEPGSGNGFEDGLMARICRNVRIAGDQAKGAAKVNVAERAVVRRVRMQLRAEEAVLRIRAQIINCAKPIRRALRSYHQLRFNSVPLSVNSKRSTSSALARATSHPSPETTPPERL